MGNLKLKYHKLFIIIKLFYRFFLDKDFLRLKSELNFWFFNRNYDYLLFKLKHKGHLLDKCVQNEFDDSRGYEAFSEVLFIQNLLLNRIRPEDYELFSWLEDIIIKYKKWESEKIFHSASGVGAPNFNINKKYWITTSRSWKRINIEEQTVRNIIDAALGAGASCNRQAFKFGIKHNNFEHPERDGASNKTMFEQAPLRIDIFYLKKAYHEKVSHAVDIGMLTQNIVLSANDLNLSTCVCYASEYSTIPQKELLSIYNLNSEYECVVNVLIGLKKYHSMKNPRRNLTSYIIKAK
jgi:hypothetical protein